MPTGGGAVFGRYAICGDHECNNVIVRSDLPEYDGSVTCSPLHLYRVTLHEPGHAPPRPRAAAFERRLCRPVTWEGPAG